MAEATLDSNQQALAPSNGGPLAARTNMPAAPTGNPEGLMDNLDPNSAEDGVTEAGPLSFMNNPDVQRILPFIVGSLALAICILFYLWVSAPTYRSVYPGMSESDRQQAKDALDGAGFAPRIDVNTGALQVADERYHEARILLASQDIPRSATAGGFENLLEQGLHDHQSIYGAGELSSGHGNRAREIHKGNCHDSRCTRALSRAPAKCFCS